MFYKQDPNKIYQTQTLVVKNKETRLMDYCYNQTHAAKLLRNATVFRGRQFLFAHNKNYKDLKEHQTEVIDEFNTYAADKYGKISETHYLPYVNEMKYLYEQSSNPDFFNSALSSHARKNVVYQTMEDFSSYFKSMKKYTQDKTNYTGKPNYPNYTKADTITVNYTNEDCRIYYINGITYLKLPNMPMNKGSKIRPNRRGYVKLGKLKIDKLMHVKISPYYDTYKICIVYEIDKTDSKLNTSRILGIDPGLNNFLTTSNNCGLHPFIINGRDMKSYNQHYNETLARLRSVLSKNQYTSAQIKHLSKKRNCYFTNKFHKITRYLINYCLINNIGVIVIGHNKLQKQNYDKSAIQNQHFCFIPNVSFLTMLKLCCETIGIQVIETDESYTSKASFFDFDDIPTYKKGTNKDYKFSGTRKHRGLFVSKNGTLINADVNGASNIIRKVFPDAFKNITDFTYLTETVDKIIIM